MTVNEIQEKIERITQYSIHSHPEKQTWPGYYKRRSLEFLTFLDYLPALQFQRILEIGCGMGFYSAFLSHIGEEVISTDLEKEDIHTHTPGLSLTRTYLKKLSINNVKVMVASADDLPYPDNTFDMVFSSHVLEHVPDSRKAINEINRVLKPGGFNFCVVPTTMDRIYNLPLHYIYMVRRLAVRVWGKFILDKSQNNLLEEQKGKTVALNQTDNWKHFPFPPPHGVLPHYLQEIKRWTPSGWTNLVTKKNTIPLVRCAGAQLNPLLPLLSPFSSGLAVNLHSMTRDFENKLGRVYPFKNLGISLIVVTQKP